ncbi:MAG: hypothetical protein EBS06_05320 [Proteobacteria bacterium]|nr:hypothetical protein [Pseudomonadota bacterium]
MTKKIQITSISQAIQLLKQAKEEYRKLEKMYQKERKDNVDLRRVLSSKGNPFENLFDLNK